MASFQKVKKYTKEWLDVMLKNIETPEEQSASGLFSMNGALVLKAKAESDLVKSGVLEGDVINGVGDERINNIAELLIKYQENFRKRNIILNIFRYQKEIKVTVELK